MFPLINNQPTVPTALNTYDIENIYNFPYLSARYAIGKENKIPEIADRVNPKPMVVADTLLYIEKNIVDTLTNVPVPIESIAEEIIAALLILLLTSIFYSFPQTGQLGFFSTGNL